MTVRTLTEIRDTDSDGDTITMIVVGQSAHYCAEIVFGQWSLGERDPSTDRRVNLELDDAIALRDALTAAIESCTAPAGDGGGR
jgi:hypothetical protein